MYRNQVSLSLLLPLSTFSGKRFLAFLGPIILSSFLLRRSGGKLFDLSCAFACLCGSLTRPSTTGNPHRRTRPGSLVSSFPISPSYQLIQSPFTGGLTCLNFRPQRLSEKLTRWSLTCWHGWDVSSLDPMSRDQSRTRARSAAKVQTGPLRCNSCECLLDIPSPLKFNSQDAGDSTTGRHVCDAQQCPVLSKFITECEPACHGKEGGLKQIL